MKINKSKALWAEYVALHENEYKPPTYEEWLEDLVIELRRKKIQDQNISPYSTRDISQYLKKKQK